MKKTKLSIFLIKEGKGVEDVIDGLAPGEEGSKRPPDRMSIEGVGDLFYIRSRVRTPSWVESFFGNTVDADMFSSASSSAVLLVTVGERLMALTFGYGRNLLNMSSIEERFGLKVVLSSGSEVVFRKVNTTSVAGNAGKNAEQLPVLSKLEAFDIDRVIDTLDKVDARIEDDELLGGTVTGGDSLTITTDKDIRTVTSQLEGILSRYESDAYREDYEWIDYVSPVKDRLTIELLEAKALKMLQDGDIGLWTAPPDLIENWDSIAGFCWQGSGGIQQDMLVEDVVASFKKGLTSFSQLKAKKIEARSADDENQALFRWSVAQCLYGEIGLDELHYCVNAGTWYRIERDYADRVNEQYHQAPICKTLSFPDYVHHSSDEKKHDEAGYNIKLANSLNDSLLMDKKMIRYGTGNSQIELCDVLVGSDTFIHVKHYSGSSTLSHLFFQGLNSATLVKSDSEFVAKANKKIASFDPGRSSSCVSGKVERVVFGIICERYEDSLPSIPFFSRISYLEVLRRLKAMNVMCEISAIRRVEDLAS